MIYYISYISLGRYSKGRFNDFDASFVSTSQLVGPCDIDTAQNDDNFDKNVPSNF